MASTSGVSVAALRAAEALVAAAVSVADSWRGGAGGGGGKRSRVRVMPRAAPDADAGTPAAGGTAAPAYGAAGTCQAAGSCGPA